MLLESQDEDEADAHEPVRDKTGAEEAYGTVLHFTLISNLHISGLVLEVVEDLQTRFDGVQLAPERRQDLKDTMKLLGVRASQKPYKVAIVGRTGSGKSTLLHALLQCSLLPTSGKGAACTSVVTEISYGDGPHITARISYKSHEQWKIVGFTALLYPLCFMTNRYPQELNHLVADALEGEADDEESEDASPAYQAREKLYQIYPHFPAPVPPLSPTTSDPNPVPEDFVSAFEGLDDGEGDETSTTTNTEPARDAESTEQGAVELGPAVLYTFAWLIRSRVLKDVFHVFHMIYISRTHGLRLALVGHFNSTGKKYTGHDSIWLSNNIQELEITLGEHYQHKPTALFWVNGNLYRKSEQTVGIVRIPQSVCVSVDIQPYRATQDAKQKQAYLAMMQGTRKPVLPVHTVAEKKLFTQLMLESPEFQKCKTSITSEPTAVWNRHAETNDEIYYKLEEQLTSYFNGAYKDSANLRLSCARARDETRPLDTELRNNTRADRIVNAPAGQLVPHRVVSGFDSDFVDVPPSSSPSTSVQQYAATSSVPVAAAQAVTRLPAGNQTRRPGKNARVIDAHEGWTARAKGVGFISKHTRVCWSLVASAKHTALYPGQGPTGHGTYRCSLQEVRAHAAWEGNGANDIVIRDVATVSTVLSTVVKLFEGVDIAVTI
ncbi:hypothetical protein B0H14DRAFT_3570508 [Mycena olivaceomarginata]|nr:hypothetical protein B0H14DRAFT_3570508 [Mycena olivaceomarginata]